MTFLAVIYPVFTFPYLRLWLFPWVIPLAFLAEITVFIMLDPVRSRLRLFLTVLGGNLLGVAVGVAVAYPAQALLQAAMGPSELDNINTLLNVGIGIAVVVVGIVKVLLWTFTFGRSAYLRRVVLLTHLLCFGVLCVAFMALPYLNMIQPPDFDLPRI